MKQEVAPFVFRDLFMGPGFSASYAMAQTDMASKEQLPGLFRKLIIQRASQRGQGLSPDVLEMKTSAAVSLTWDLLDYDAVRSPFRVSNDIPFQIIMGDQDELNEYGYVVEYFNLLRRSGKFAEWVGVRGGPHNLPTDRPNSIISALLQTTRQ